MADDLDVERGQGELIAAGATDIDGDGLRENIHHGDLVSLYVRTDDVEILKFPIDEARHSKEQLLASLRAIGAMDADGELPDAVMFCWESSTLVSSFGATLRPEGRPAYKEIIRRWAVTDENWCLTHEIILALEDLASRGVLVVTIAGNSGPAWVNTYTFAEGVLVVGAIEQDPDGEWATRNGLIDAYAQSSFEVRLVGDAERPAFGYDIDEDGRADIGLKRGSSHFRRFGTLRETHRVLKGTSFAAPTALKDMLAQGPGRVAPGGPPGGPFFDESTRKPEGAFRKFPHFIKWNPPGGNRPLVLEQQEQWQVTLLRAKLDLIILTHLSIKTYIFNRNTEVNSILERVMIRNETEYKKAVERIKEEAARIEAQKAELKTMGLSPTQITRATDPLVSFHLQLVEEVESHEKLKRGEFDPVMNLGGLGILLISVRIAKGISQKELAGRLGVHESQVSRDERNEYHGITLERAQRVIEALGVQVMSRVEQLDHQVA